MASVAARKRSVGVDQTGLGKSEEEAVTVGRERCAGGPTGRTLPSWELESSLQISPTSVIIIASPPNPVDSLWGVPRYWVKVYQEDQMCVITCTLLALIGTHCSCVTCSLCCDIDSRR